VLLKATFHLGDDVYAFLSVPLGLMWLGDEGVGLWISRTGGELEVFDSSIR